MTRGGGSPGRARLGGDPGARTARPKAPPGALDRGRGRALDPAGGMPSSPRGPPTTLRDGRFAGGRARIRPVEGGKGVP